MNIVKRPPPLTRKKKLSENYLGAKVQCVSYLGPFNYTGCSERACRTEIHTNTDNNNDNLSNKARRTQAFNSLACLKKTQIFCITSNMKYRKLKRLGSPQYQHVCKHENAYKNYPYFTYFTALHNRAHIFIDRPEQIKRYVMLRTLS